MNPIIVEHQFITTLPSAQAMQLLGWLLRGRGFAQQDQKLDAARPDWSVVTFARGTTSPSQISSVIHFPQTFTIEWDHGRFNLALSLDPLKANPFVRQECEKLLPWIATLLQSALTGERGGEEVLADWARQESASMLPPGSAGTASFSLGAMHIETWIWCCLVGSGLAILWGMARPMCPFWAKGLLLLCGSGAGYYLWVLKNRQPPLPVDRTRLISAGLTGGLWSLLMAIGYLAPILQMKVMQAWGGTSDHYSEKTEQAKPDNATPDHSKETHVSVTARPIHRDTPEQKTPVNQTHEPAPKPPSPPPPQPRQIMKVTDMASAKAALQSTVTADQDAAIFYLSSQPTISSDVREVLADLLTTQDAERRKTFVTLFCKDAGASDVARLESICREPDDKFINSLKPAFTALLLNGADKARGVWEDRSKDHRFNFIASACLASVAPTHEEICIAMLASDNKEILEPTLRALRRFGTAKCLPALQSAKSRPAAEAAAGNQISNAIKDISKRTGS